MDNLSSTRLGFSYWFVSHKLALKRMATIVLAVLDILLVTYAVYLVVLNFGIRQQQHDAIVNSLLHDSGFSSLAAARDTQLPAALVPQGIETLAAGTKADIIATVVNPNAKWGATFTYSFALASGQTQPRSGFIFPGETKKLYDLNVDDGVTASAISFTDVSWKRENEFAALYKSRLSFAYPQVTFIPSQELQVGQTVSVSRAQFTVSNTTSYNYRNVGFTVFLYSGSSMVGVNSVFLDQLLSGDQKQVEATWFTRLPKVTNVQIIPEINILDPEVYL